MTSIWGMTKGHEWKKLADSFPVASCINPNQPGFFFMAHMNFLGPLRMTSSPAPSKDVFPASHSLRLFEISPPLWVSKLPDDLI